MKPTFSISSFFVLFSTYFILQGCQNFKQTQAATSAEFYCDEKNLQTKVESHSYDNPLTVINWRQDNDYFGDEWTPLKRCQEVSRRFQNIYERDGLKYIQTDLAQWKDRDIAIVCSVKVKDTRCEENDLLLTLENKDDPNQVLGDLKAFKENPINNRELTRGENSPKTFSEGKRDVYDIEEILSLPEPPKQSENNTDSSETPKSAW